MAKKTSIRPESSQQYQGIFIFETVIDLEPSDVRHSCYGLIHACTMDPFRSAGRGSRYASTYFS